MEELLNKIAEQSKRVGLTEAEREFMRVRLVEYASRPQAAAAGRSGAAQAWFRRLSLLSLRSSARPALAVAMIVAVLGSGAGVSYAAEGAVPGDALYGFKIAVNEGVSSVLAVTPEAKARWETRRVERRLEEAEALVSAGKLDDAKAADLEDKISAHAADADEQLAEIGRGGDDREAAELGSELESALQGHAAVMGRLSRKPADGREAGAANIIRAAEEQAGHAAAHRSDSERAVAGPDNRRAAEASLADAEKKLAAAESGLGEARLSAETVDQVGALVERAKTAIEAGRTSLAGGDFNAAFSAFQEAGRNARQALMLIKAEKKWPNRTYEGDGSRPRGGDEGASDDQRGENGERQRSSGRGSSDPGRD